MPPIDLDDPAVKLYLNTKIDAFGRKFESRRMSVGPHIIGRKHDTCHCAGLTPASFARLKYVTEQYGKRESEWGPVIFPDRCDPKPGTIPFSDWKKRN